MGIMVTRLKLQSNKRCEICHKPFMEGYRINLHGYNVFVCSGRDAETARQRWEEKVKLGIKPGVPYKPEEKVEEDMMAENIPGEGGEE